MQSLLTDLRYALRSLRTAPAFTIAAVLTLALGIGFNTAIFSVVNTVLIQKLPYKDSDRIVMMYETEPELPKAPVTEADLIDWRERSRTFETISSFQPFYAALTGSERPARLLMSHVTTEFFRTLGVLPALGRAFSAEEGTEGRNRVVILTDSLFQSRFGGDRRLLGRTIILDGSPHTVVGVMPPGFRVLTRFPFTFEAFTPMVLTARSRGGTIASPLAG